MSGKIKDLTNMKFNNLLVLGLEKRENGQTIWRCLCDCGNQCLVNGQSLKSENTKSCGCWVRKHEDLTNSRFGKLFVMEERSKGEGKEFLWLCLCDCGGETIASSGNLKRGHTTSCGCETKKRMSKLGKTGFKDLTGKKFGFLYVEKYYGKSKDGRRGSDFLCTCDCGTKNVIVSGSSLTSGGTKSCGCLMESYIASTLKSYCFLKYKSLNEYKIFRNPKTGFFLPFDIYVKKYNLYIEIHGNQHYYFDSRLHRTIEVFEYSKWKDKIKKKYAESNGFYLEIDLRKIKEPVDAKREVRNKIKEIRRNIK